MTIRLDSDQQAAVTAASNTVVSAGAGSGKTSVLAERYLRLVRNDRIPVDEVLALTFTRKAAAEMYHRIYRKLQDHADEPFVREQLARFETATISTLDSFCASIARSGCSRLGISPTFTIDDAGLIERIEARALSFLLENSDRPSVASAIRLNRFVPFWRDGLTKLAAERFSIVGTSRPSAFLSVQANNLVRQIDLLTRSLTADLDRITACDPEVAACIAKAHSVLATLDVTEIESGVLTEELSAVVTGSGSVSAGIRERVAAAIEVVGHMKRISLTCGAGHSPDVLAFKDAVRHLRDIVPRLAEAWETALLWDSICDLHQLLDRFHDSVLAEKRSTGVLTYHDVMDLALDVLEHDPQLRSHYRGRFRAIMIDEFQDNNDKQKRLLYLLAEEGDDLSGPPSPDRLSREKLFFVGDEKQSIYRFRGADVSVFRRLSGELTGGEAIRLCRNYRSEPGLIAFFNELFSRVFGGAQAPFEARFQPLESANATPGVVPEVEMWAVPEDNGGDGFLSRDDAEAFHLARHIAGTVREQTLSLGDRSVTWSDIAILFRSSSNQIRIERMLRLFGVPYVAQSVRSLFLEAPINDMYQVLQLVLYPSDRVAYAGYLRSPMAGLSDDAVVAILVSGEEPFTDHPDLSGDDADRYAICRSRYHRLVSLADTVPITALLHEIWYEWGYRYHLLRRPEYATYLEYYDYFWEMAARYEERGLSAFLDEVRRHIGQNERLEELDIIRGDQNGVHVMTIHKSKGLEFPIVYIVNTANKGAQGGAQRAPFYWSEELGPAFNTGTLADGAVREKAVNYVYTSERDENDLQELAERKRLLYVAATRARTHLFFSGVDRLNTPSLAALLREPFAASVEKLGGRADLSIAVRQLPAVTVEEELAARGSSRDTDIVALAARYRETVPPERDYPPCEVSVTAINDAVRRLLADSRPAGSTSITGDSLSVDAVIEGAPEEAGLAARFGSYCHFCVEMLGATEAIPSEPPPIGRVPEPLRPSLEGDALDCFLRDGYDLARRFASSEDGRRLAAARTTNHELPFLMVRIHRDGRIYVRGKIDLVAEFDDHIVVLDFKSDRHLISTDYVGQLQIYAAAAGELFGKPIRTALYHLRSGRLVYVDPDVASELLVKAIDLALGTVKDEIRPVEP